MIAAMVAAMVVAMVAAMIGVMGLLWLVPWDGYGWCHGMAMVAAMVAAMVDAMGLLWLLLWLLSSIIVFLFVSEPASCLLCCVRFIG